MMKIVDQALAILATEPFPEDAREQIDKLYEQAGEAEISLFSEIYEGLFFQENSQKKEDE